MLAQVVQRVESIILLMNPLLLNNSIGFCITYPMENEQLDTVPLTTVWITGPGGLLDWLHTDNQLAFPSGLTLWQANRMGRKSLAPFHHNQGNSDNNRNNMIP